MCRETALGSPGPTRRCPAPRWKRSTLEPGARRRPVWQPYLTFASEAGLLQPRPDALDPAGVLGVAVGVPAAALVLQHQRVVHEAWGRACGPARQSGRASSAAAHHLPSKQAASPPGLTEANTAFRPLGPLVGKIPVHQRPSGVPRNGSRGKCPAHSTCPEVPGVGGASQEERNGKTPHATPHSLSRGHSCGRTVLSSKTQSF